MIIKYAAWSLKTYYKSEHPEYVAIRNLVSKNPKHDFVLVGTGLKYEHFRCGKTFFYNLGLGNTPKYFLSILMRFMLPLLIRPSVVVVLGGGLSLVSSGLASFFIRAKFIPTVVGDLSYSFLSIPKSIRILPKALSMAIFQRSYGILAISKSIKKELVNDYRIDLNRVFVYKYNVSDIFNPNISRDLKKSLNPSGPVILTVARISPEKGLHYLVEASRTVVEKIPNARFVIQPYSSQLKYKKYLLSIINKYGLQEYFRIFTKKVPYSEMPSYMAAADVFVLPSLSEGMPTTILEAMASGVPVVASRVGGIPDIVVHGHNGMLVEPADVTGLAESILKVLLNEELRKKLSKGAIVTVHKSKENEFENLLKHFINHKSV
jgi:glycosyltransferase involved in cell wall biosynthesis